MSKLLPCPFQKEGETHDVRFVELKPGYGQIGCADCEFWFPSDDMLTFEEAKARWNTRHERTCENVYEGREFECSECGTQWHLLERTDAFDEWAHVRTPDFCPSCGAKVVRQ